MQQTIFRQMQRLLCSARTLGLMGFVWYSFSFAPSAMGQAKKVVAPKSVTTTKTTTTSTPTKTVAKKTVSNKAKKVAAKPVAAKATTAPARHEETYKDEGEFRVNRDDGHKARTVSTTTTTVVTTTVGGRTVREYAPNSTEAANERSRVLRRLADNMVRVDGGSFMMGATAEQGSQANADEKPAHRVQVSSFYIGKYEVTQAEWKAVMDENPSYHRGDNLPVENVSWQACQDFIRRLNSLTGKHYRLPTEAEWEYAARGGASGGSYVYAGSNTLSEVAWCNANAGGETHPVGQRKANELGLYDMNGNVWEWCADWYGSYDKVPTQSNPTGVSSGSSRVLRGGSFYDFDQVSRVSVRYWNAPSEWNFNIGLRLVLDR